MSVAHNYPSQVASRRRLKLRCGSKISVRSVEIAALAMTLIAGLGLLHPGDVSAQSRAPANPPQTSQIQGIAVRTPTTEQADLTIAPARKPVRVIQIWKTPPQQGDVEK